RPHRRGGRQAHASGAPPGGLARTALALRGCRGGGSRRSPRRPVRYRLLFRARDARGRAHMAFELGRRTHAAALRALGVAGPRPRRRPARRGRFCRPRQRAGGLWALDRRSRLSVVCGGDAMTRNEARRGVVLVTVLWSIALLSALAMAASVTFRGF